MLEAKGIQPTIIKYLESPPDRQELVEILHKLGLDAEQIVRKGDALFKDLGLTDKALNNEQWIDILVQNPSLIERPIVVNGSKAAIGRPIERVIDIL